ncbi:MAG TPA: hypothetical protein DCQ43_04560 [Treponema sp.]|nr:hypothetical protein [Treponema sp.]
MRLRFCVLCLLTLLCQFASYALDWTLAAEAFNYVQVREISASEKKAAEELPLLILEQISENLVRLPSEKELEERSLASLRSERIALFLQLSAAVQERDSIVISGASGFTFQSKLNSAEKKISDIEKKLEQNLAKTKALSSQKISSVKAESLQLRESLFVLPQEAIGLSPQSQTYQNAVSKAGINGLITADIRVYGNYASVTASLTVFPGATVVGTVTEVGSLSDIVTLAERLAESLIPYVTNSLPVELHFKITPSECASNMRVAIDGIMYDEGDAEQLVNAGIHNVEVSCEGYVTKRFSYSFSESPVYDIRVNLLPLQEIEVDLSLKKSLLADDQSLAFYTSDLLQKTTKDGRVHLMLGGQNSLGQIVRLNEDGSVSDQTAFFLIPQQLQVSGQQLSLETKTENAASLIDTRRIWTYRAYSALLVSLPFTFLCWGNYASARNAYLAGSLNSLETVYAWNVATYVTLGISAACTVFFIIELVRYLRAADSVIPAEVRALPPSVEEH